MAGRRARGGAGKPRPTKGRFRPVRSGSASARPRAVVEELRRRRQRPAAASRPGPRAPAARCATTARSPPACSAPSGSSMPTLTGADDRNSSSTRVWHGVDSVTRTGDDAASGCCTHRRTISQRVGPVQVKRASPVVQRNERGAGERLGGVGADDVLAVRPLGALGHAQPPAREHRGAGRMQQHHDARSATASAARGARPAARPSASAPVDDARPPRDEREEPQQDDRVLRRHADERRQPRCPTSSARGSQASPRPRAARPRARPAASSADHASTGGRAERAELRRLVPPPVLRVVEGQRHLPHHAPVVGRDHVIHARPDAGPRRVADHLHGDRAVAAAAPQVREARARQRHLGDAAQRPDGAAGHAERAHERGAPATMQSAATPRRRARTGDPPRSSDAGRPGPVRRPAAHDERGAGARHPQPDAVHREHGQRQRQPRDRSHHAATGAASAASMP